MHSFVILAKASLSYSLVGPQINAFLPREAKHATDDPAVHPCPILVTNLSPLAFFFHLQKAISDGDPFPVGVSSSDPYILHMDRHTLRHKSTEIFH